MRKALALLVVVAVVGVAVGVGGLFRSGSVDANQHGASRSLPTAPVPAGGELTVMITVTGLGADGQVTGQVAETLPEGFSYVEGSVSLDADPVEIVGQTVTFTMFQHPDVFTYKVTASNTPDTYSFMGVVRQLTDPINEEDIGGDTDVTVEADAPVVVPPTPTQEPPSMGVSATRSFDTDSVAPGGEVVVTIDVTGLGSYGQVEETLPTGFAYVSTDLVEEAVERNGQVVTFTLFGKTNFTYTVTASNNLGSYDFMGVVKESPDPDQQGAVGGATSVMVEDDTPPAAMVSASRSFTPTSPARGGQVVVMITVSQYGSFAQVVETLPAGFIYESTNLADEEAVETDGQKVTFTLFGELEFTYTVTAPDADASFTFSGILKTSHDDPGEAIAGASSIRVGPEPTPVTPEPTSTRRPSRGGVGVAPVTAATAVPTPAPTAEPTVEPTAEPTMEPATPEPTVDMMMMGPEGEQGAQGEQGEQGAQGDPGPRGETGARGPDGPQGAAGSDGSAGAMGAAGDLGAAGAGGQDGARGPTGQIGADGQTGAAGDAGATGASGGVSVLHIIALIIAIVALVAAGGAYLARRS